MELSIANIAEDDDGADEAPAPDGCVVDTPGATS